LNKRLLRKVFPWISMTFVKWNSILSLELFVTSDFLVGLTLDRAKSDSFAMRPDNIREQLSKDANSCDEHSWSLPDFSFSRTPPWRVPVVSSRRDTLWGFDRACTQKVTKRYQCISIFTVKYGLILYLSYKSIYKNYFPYYKANRTLERELDTDCMKYLSPWRSSTERSFETFGAVLEADGYFPSVLTVFFAIQRLHPFDHRNHRVTSLGTRFSAR
jgi:hypothetical protein